jgi:hypothetical protein
MSISVCARIGLKNPRNQKHEKKYRRKQFRDKNQDAHRMILKNIFIVELKPVYASISARLD